MISYTNVFRRARNLVANYGSDDMRRSRDRNGRFTANMWKAVRFDPVMALRKVCREHELERRVENMLVKRLMNENDQDLNQYSFPEEAFDRVLENRNKLFADEV